MSSCATVTQGDNGWEVTYTSAQICALKGSTVHIPCSYTYPTRINEQDTKVEKEIWFKGDERTDLPHRGDNDCTLTITDLRESDSAEYKFRFITNQPKGRYTGSPGVTLSVTDLQVQVDRLQVNQFHNWAEMTCRSSCLLPGHPRYVWYKNGLRVLGHTSDSYSDSFNLTDDFSCAVEGNEEFPSPAAYAPMVPSVSASPSAEILEGSSVTLSCSSEANPAATYTWYRENGYESPHSLSKEAQLVFGSIQSSDSGEYYCEAENSLGRTKSDYISIDLTYGPKLPSVSVSPSGDIMEGSSVNLSCSSDANPAANYTWYKKNVNVKAVSEEAQLVFRSIQSSDSGEYYCAAENELGRRTSQHISVDVKYAPKDSSVSVSPSGDIVEGSSVTLSCSSDANPAANYTWYKDNEDSPKASGQIFTITDFRAEHSGNYYCEAQNRRGGLNITLHLTVVAGAGRLIAAGTVPVVLLPIVSLFVFLWIRKKRASNESSDTEERPDSRELAQGQDDLQYASILFSSSRADDLNSNIGPAQPLRHMEQQEPTEYAAVKYTRMDQELVQGHSGWGVWYTPPQICASKGSTVQIRCIYSYPRRVKNVEDKFWFINSINNDYVNLKTESEYLRRVKYDCDETKLSCTLTITDLKESDSAEYKFRFITDLLTGKYTGDPGVTLTVADLQVQVDKFQVHESFNWAQMTCRSSCHLPGHPRYAWYKNGWKIQGQTSDSYSDYVSHADSYSCAVDGYEASRSPPVYAPKSPSVSASPSKEIVEGNSVTLNCSSDANPAAHYTWYKKNVNVKAVSEEAQLVFRSIESSDSGEYYCAAENELGRRTSQHISIDVKYAPKLPSVLVSPSGEIVEGMSVTLRCHSDANPPAKYTWYKSQKLLQGPEGSYHFTSISSEHRGNYSCKSENKYGQNMSLPLFLDVWYAPKLPSVSVSNSGEIMEGSSVTLSCSSDANPAANYTWYKENEDSPKASGQIFTITNARAEHSGNYSCAAQNRRGRHNSTLHLTVVAGGWKSAVIGTTPAVFLAIIWLSVYLLIRKNRAAKRLSGPGRRPGSREEGRSLDCMAELALVLSCQQL
ncbi:cell adhesion molecule CEACAM5-like [Chaetodon trifascialis]|uniref:cell adhesion molecule CEACAM5-like n=1 Tax=Chaetodon trifascialis TaxID=109706 RepID=UPI003995EC20